MDQLDTSVSSVGNVSSNNEGRFENALGRAHPAFRQTLQLRCTGFLERNLQPAMIPEAIIAPPPPHEEQLQIVPQDGPIVLPPPEEVLQQLAVQGELLWDQGRQLADQGELLQDQGQALQVMRKLFILYKFLFRHFNVPL